MLHLGKYFISVIETVEMSILGAFYGTLVTIPLAWCAAWNITPSRKISLSLFPVNYRFMSLSSNVDAWTTFSFSIRVLAHFAGVLALAIGTIGFAGKIDGRTM